MGIIFLSVWTKLDKVAVLLFMVVVVDTMGIHWWCVVFNVFYKITFCEKVNW